MINLLKLILLTSLIFGDDGEGPLLTNIISTSDFYYGKPIQIDIKAVDKDEISEMFSKDTDPIVCELCDDDCDCHGESKVCDCDNDCECPICVE